MKNLQKGFIPNFIILAVVVLVIGGGIYFYSIRNSNNLIGGDRDTHGCIGSAGYSWCEVKNKCLRIWEEKCEDTSITTVSTSTN